MSLLLHCCCGPCALLVAEHFRESGNQVVGWFYNPNIHPEAERLRRQDTMEEAAAAIELPLLEHGPTMSFGEFLLLLAGHGGVRCRSCYQLRLEETARRAAEEGMEAFSSTLLISPYQDLEAIAEVGRRVAGEHGVEFRYADLREQYAASCERARREGLYRQSYCGCAFSALERAERRTQRAVAKVRRAARA